MPSQLGQGAANVQQVATLQLAIRKGSRLMPLALLLAAIFVFIRYLEGSTWAAFTQSVQLKEPILDFILNAIQVATKNAVGSYGGNALVIVTAQLKTVGTIVLYALLPGIAGMIYRRSFWRYFLITFAILYAINAVGWLGRIPGTNLPDSQRFSEGLIYFVLSQMLLLLLAFRLRRHSRGTRFLNAKVYNVLLAVVLAAIAVAVAYDWPAWAWKFLPNRFYTWEFILVVLPVLYMLLKQRELWGSTARKNIVVCLDGTGQTTGQTEFGRSRYGRMCSSCSACSSRTSPRVPSWACLCRRKAISTLPCRSATRTSRSRSITAGSAIRSRTAPSSTSSARRPASEPTVSSIVRISTSCGCTGPVTGSSSSGSAAAPPSPACWPE